MTLASVINLRYFVFAHVFMLLGAALLIQRAPTAAARGILATAALGGSLFAYAVYCDKLDLGNPNDGFMAVAEYLDNHRAKEQPVVIATAYAFFPVLAHTRQKENIRFYVKDALVHYDGTAALTSDLVVSDRAFHYPLAENRNLWLVELEQAGFELPDGWKRNLRASFEDDVVPGRKLYVTECTAE